MKLILISDVQELGKRGDVVDVAEGYARNYLLPRKKAVKANEGALAQAEAVREARIEAERKAKDEAERLATQLVGSRVVIAAQAGDEGQLYGSIAVADVVEGVRRFTGIELDRAVVEIPKPIKAIGLHEIQIKLHADVEFPLTLDVIPAS
ncbi:MAG TPA: 50S ribosomal protein L9 [Acidimicrobiia bacterium]|nr:50S ribosomal protein L9 [Acidimicrobiia bacterium]